MILARITAAMLGLCGGALPGASLQGTYSLSDLTFLTHMIVHHQQALELCALVNERSQRAELQQFARYLYDAQQAEIEQMQALLAQAAARGAVLPEAHSHADPPMAGMLSRAQMSAITRARGAQFERLWLDGMILHHQGAVDMALAQQEAQFRNRNQPFGLDTLVDEMLAVQRAEIARMRDWLAEWR
jgi:uncharacterized protein (DUF305 family)